MSLEAASFAAGTGQIPVRGARRLAEATSQCIDPFWPMQIAYCARSGFWGPSSVMHKMVRAIWKVLKTKEGLNWLHNCPELAAKEAISASGAGLKLVSSYGSPGHIE